MPIHRLVLPYDAFRGTIASPFQPADALVLYDTPRSALVTRKWLVPTNPQSAGQTSVRAALAHVARSWTEILTVSNRTIYNNLATVTKLNALGLEYKPSGFNWFCDVAYHQYMQPGTISNAAPTDLTPTAAPSAVTAISLTVTPPDTIITINCDMPADPDPATMYMSIELSTPIPPGRVGRRNLTSYPSTSWRENAAEVTIYGAEAENTISIATANLKYAWAAGQTVSAILRTWIPGRVPSAPLWIPSITLASL